MHRTKKNPFNLPKEDGDETETRNTINSNKSNKYIYNKKNIYSHIKKINIDLSGDKTSNDRRQIATPVYKRSPLLSPSSYKLNLDSNKNNNKNKIYFTNKINKQKIITSPQNNHKYYSYRAAFNSPNNNIIEKKLEKNLENKVIKNDKEKDNEVEQISISEKYNEKNKKCVKKINAKIQGNSRDNYTNNNNKINKLIRGRIINNGNINNENQSAVLVGNSNNTYLNSVNYININTPKKPLMKCYLSPKYNNPQVFNNFYSINCHGNVNAPLKVINVYKK